MKLQVIKQYHYAFRQLYNIYYNCDYTLYWESACIGPDDIYYTNQFDHTFKVYARDFIEILENWVNNIGKCATVYPFKSMYTLEMCLSRKYKL